jgi:hypothetical protein
MPVVVLLFNAKLKLHFFLSFHFCSAESGANDGSGFPLLLFSLVLTHKHESASWKAAKVLVSIA